MYVFTIKELDKGDDMYHTIPLPHIYVYIMALSTTHCALVFISLVEHTHFISFVVRSVVVVALSY